jgi:hypothetical protein
MLTSQLWTEFDANPALMALEKHAFVGKMEVS